MPALPECPLCKKPTAHAFRPFCSKGCKDRDLLSWFDESYRVPARVDDDDEADSIATGEHG
jgi:uncharacterized protein